MDESITGIQMGASGPGNAITKMVDDAHRARFGMIAGNETCGVSLQFGCGQAEKTKARATRQER